MDRCPACRARLADADICPRCGADFSISRRAERQAQRLSQIAVRELFLGETQNAAAAAETAAGLASPLLARAVTRMIRRRESDRRGVVAGTPAAT
jgi:predicted amidophosphoribosyltransferase